MSAFNIYEDYNWGTGTEVAKGNTMGLCPPLATLAFGLARGAADNRPFGSVGVVSPALRGLRILFQCKLSHSFIIKTDLDQLYN